MLHSGLRDAAERHIAETCATNILRFKSDKQRAVNQRSLSELFISFLEKVTIFAVMLYLDFEHGAWFCQDLRRLLIIVEVDWQCFEPMLTLYGLESYSLYK